MPIAAARRRPRYRQSRRRGASPAPGKAPPSPDPTRTTAPGGPTRTHPATRRQKAQGIERGRRLAPLHLPTSSCTRSRHRFRPTRAVKGKTCGLRPPLTALPDPIGAQLSGARETSGPRTHQRPAGGPRHAHHHQQPCRRRQPRKDRPDLARDTPSTTRNQLGAARDLLNLTHQLSDEKEVWDAINSLEDMVYRIYGGRPD